MKRKGRGELQYWSKAKSESPFKNENVPEIISEKLAFKSLQVPVESHMSSKEIKTLQVGPQEDGVEIRMQQEDVRNIPLN